MIRPGVRYVRCAAMKRRLIVSLTVLLPVVFLAGCGRILTDAELARLRGCEAKGWTDPYVAVSPTGKYRGAYQFSLRTWAGVGGAGDPIRASHAEQDIRARILFARDGAGAWPICGRGL